MAADGVDERLSEGNEYTGMGGVGQGGALSRMCNVKVRMRSKVVCYQRENK